MFSSLSSFLPSLPLHIGHGNNSPGTPLFNPINNPEEEEAESAADQPVEEAETGKMMMKKSKNANETFIFVRPPPAKSNHPLNLQVQLVPPTAQPRRSSEFDAGADNPVNLARTISNRSDTSESGYGSTASFASSTSASPGRRTIIPLYSLQAHNVMANVIVDAGTDVKIAKLQRRGMELVDLANLEAIEVWAERARPFGPVTPEPMSTTAASSTASLSSGSLAQPVSTVHVRPSLERQSSPQRRYTPQPSPKPIVPEPTKRNIFGRIFKKSKDITPPATPTTLTVITSDAQPTIPGRPTSSRGHGRKTSLALGDAHAGRRPSSPNPLLFASLQVPGQEPANASTTDISISGVTDDKIIRPPVLGIQPTISYSYLPPGTTSSTPSPNGSSTPRALMYVWFVKKWLKRRADHQDASGFFNTVQQMHASRRGSGTSTAGHGPVEEGVEVRFEWKRTSGKGKGRTKGQVKDKEIRKAKEKVENRGGVHEKESRRFSVISHHSAGPDLGFNEESGRSGTPIGRSRKTSLQDRSENFADYDSDPEDSETPWVCTLKLRRTGSAVAEVIREPGSPAVTQYGKGRPVTANGAEKVASRDANERVGLGTGSSGSSQVLRIKVGTLSPTPHHPKLVGMLKVPFPLPDVELERMGISRRPPGYTNSRPPPSQWEGTTLSAEEIKDVVCCTGLWLVVREGFGGVGRVNRRGDGWRIRA